MPAVQVGRDDEGKRTAAGKFLEVRIDASDFTLAVPRNRGSPGWWQFQLCATAFSARLPIGRINACDNSVGRIDAIDVLAIEAIVAALTIGVLAAILLRDGR